MHYTNEGFIVINRGFFKNDMWLRPRVFSEREAWLDLVQMARFANDMTEAYIGSIRVEWGRGQVPVSVRYLATHWQRTEKWVRVFLRRLEKFNEIKIETDQGISVITIVDYDRFSLLPYAKAWGTARAQQGHGKGTNNKYNETKG